MRSDLGALLDLVSPSFFDVLPARSLWREGKALLASRRKASHAERQLQHLGERLRGCGIQAESTEARLLLQGSSGDPSVRGQMVLDLYFAQLGGCDHTLLDLRTARFTDVDRGLLWRPTALGVDWSPEFLSGLREMYAGFYRDDSSRFASGVATLGLEPAADLLREQFGGDDQRAVDFDASKFKRVFHAIFVRCRDAGVRLHSNFVPLGIFLGALYQHLDSLGVELDVRRAFDSVWPT